MGAWGAGLYSSDLGRDLRETIAGLVRFPFDGERLLELIRIATPEAADNPDDEDHSTFWLVTADQFRKHGIESTLVTETAIAIIDSGADNAMMAELGMSPTLLRRRAHALAKLRERLTSTAPLKRRRTITKAQPYIMDVGDVISYPTSRGAPLHSTFKKYGWTQDAWAALLIIERGRAFELVPWYSFLVVRKEMTSKPSLDDALQVPWSLRGAGPCSAADYKRLGFETIGNVEIDQEALKAAIGHPLPDGTENTIVGDSIWPYLFVASEKPRTIVAGLNDAPSLELLKIAQVRT